jgi:hypothetical protein
MSVFLFFLALYLIGVFIAGFKQGWAQENITRSARGLFLSKLRSYGEPIDPAISSASQWGIEKVIEGRLTSVCERRGLIGRGIE